VSDERVDGGASAHGRNGKSGSTKSNRVQSRKVAQIPVLQTRGIRIASIPGQIRRIDSRRYQVKSQSQNKWYSVTWEKRLWKCTCAFNAKTHQSCKHVYGVLYRISETGESWSEHEDSEMCPKCQRVTKIIRRGYYKSRTGLTQRFGCKKCNRRFSVRTGFKNMKYNANTITSALDLFFKGLSLRSIANHLNQIYGYHISHLTVYRWISRYVKLIAENMPKAAPKVSNRWHVDEMRIGVNGDIRNLWNLMDHKTRYLLAMKVTQRKGRKEARRLLTNAITTSRPQRLTLISDGLSSYKGASQDSARNSGIVIEHLSDTGLKRELSNNLVERLNRTVRGRVKTMGGLDNERSARLFAEGYSIFYNHIRPHMALKGQTPGEAAKTWRPLGANRWRSLIRDSAVRKDTRSARADRSHQPKTGPSPN